MSFAIVKNGTPFEISGDFEANDGALYSSSVLPIWTPQERLSKGIRPIVDGPIPEGHTVTGEALTWDTQTVTRVYTTQAIPLADLKAESKRRWQGGDGRRRRAARRWAGNP